MASLRGALLRSWRWTQAEWRRRRNLTECIVILVMAQVVVLLCVIMPQRLQRKPNLMIEDQKKIGQYVVLYTTAEISDYPEDGINNSIPRIHSDEEVTLQKLPKINSHGNLPNRKSKLTKKAEGSMGGEQDTYSNEPVDISGISEPISLKDLNHYGNSDGGEIDAYEDPVVGRGFQDEFVTHKSDGKGFVLYGPGTRNSSIEGLDRTYESVSLTVTSDRTNRFLQKYDPSDGRLNKRHISANDSSDTANQTDKANNYKFKHYDINSKHDFVFIKDETSYFTEIDGKECFVSGTDIEKTKVTKGVACSCLQYHYGNDCSIPEAVWFGKSSEINGEVKLTKRKVPRRVINGLPVNHEFAMFEARIHELYDVVDVFLIVESNYTSHGDPKELFFLKRFQSGYLAEFQDKIHYIQLPFFSDDAKNDGWRADSYLRFYMGSKGLRQIKGIRDDDLFILSDADELPTREVVTFLKLYDGYPEPVGFGLQWNIFGFYWQVPGDKTFMSWLTGSQAKMLVIYSAATVGMVQKVLLNNVFYIRKEYAWEHPQLKEKVKSYREEGHVVNNWVIGSINHYAGWHCSWCFSPAGIVQKLNSAQANDKPRWGDYPEKKNITYVISRIWNGRWFNDKDTYLPVKTRGRFYAPSFFLEHPESYRSLLYHPGHSININRSWQPP